MLGTRSITHSYDTSNRLNLLNVNGVLTGFAYDAQGNITGRGSQGYYFDQGNRMQLANGIASYNYDGHGRRMSISAASGNTRYQVYSQAGQLLYGIEQQGASSWETRYVYLGNKLVAETRAGVTTYQHTDALGSPVAKTNAAGQLLSRTRYEPYGATAAGTNPDGIGFTGHVNDLATGLVYMQQRYYDPVAGRFLSVDPVTTNADTGAMFNRYVYANNNPYGYADPDGRAPIAVPILLGAISGAIGAMKGPDASIGRIAAGALGGAAAGALGTLAVVGKTLAATVGQAALAGGLGSTAGQIIGNPSKPPSAMEAATQAATSAVGGVAGHGAAAAVRGASTAAETASVASTVSSAVSAAANLAIPQSLGGLGANKAPAPSAQPAENPSN